jgi:NAD(P)-dependent dehydrogenase (short-subunit alcohol dehydrogenase family)
MFDFKNKTLLITGGNSGLGKACALMFAQAGAKVIISARREKESLAVIDEIKTAGGDASFIQVDLANPDSINNMMKETLQTFGQLDFAINNAGVVGNTQKPFTDFSEDDYNLVMDINVKGMFLSMQQQLKIMKQQKYGVIINLSSVAGLKAGRASPLYTASKHAVIGLTRAAAKEHAKLGIRINAICPALIETPMLVDAKFYNGKPISEGIPVGRLGKPEEVANAACWLCSDLSAYVTGIALPVDGGIMA